MWSSQINYIIFALYLQQNAVFGKYFFNGLLKIYI